MPFSDALVSPIRLSQNVTKCHTPVSFCTKPKTLCQSVMPQYDCHTPYNSILIQFLWGQMHKVKTHHLVQISDFFQIQTVLFCWASKQFILPIIFVHSWNNFPQIAGIEPFLHSQYHNFLSNLLIITVWERYFITNSGEKSAPCIEILMCFRQSSQNSLRWYFISTSFYHSISSSTISHFPSTM